MSASFLSSLCVSVFIYFSTSAFYCFQTREQKSEIQSRNPILANGQRKALDNADRFVNWIHWIHNGHSSIYARRRGCMAIAEKVALKFSFEFLVKSFHRLVKLFIGFHWKLSNEKQFGENHFSAANWMPIEFNESFRCRWWYNRLLIREKPQKRLTCQRLSVFVCQGTRKKRNVPVKRSDETLDQNARPTAVWPSDQLRSCATSHRAQGPSD